MKYLSFFLLFLSIFLLSSCFQKKIEITATGSEYMTGENISAELPGDEQIIGVGTGEQIPEDNRTENTNTGSSNASVSGSSGVTTEEEQIVEEYADDLDKLFDDLLEGE